MWVHLTPCVYLTPYMYFTLYISFHFSRSISVPLRVCPAFHPMSPTPCLPTYISHSMHVSYSMCIPICVFPYYVYIRLRIHVPLCVYSTPYVFHSIYASHWATWQHTKKVYISLFQLKARYSAIDTFLVRIGVIKTPECWWYKETEQPIEHLYIKCRKWRRQKRKLTQSLSVKKINWQDWTDKKGLAKLVADKRALEPILEF